jgi:DNA-binding CsgD family transcriptional regulator
MRPRLPAVPPDALVALAAAGLSLRQIGRQVGMSHEAVRYHLTRIKAVKA